MGSRFGTENEPVEEDETIMVRFYNVELRGDDTEIWMGILM